MILTGTRVYDCLAGVQGRQGARGDAAQRPGAGGRRLGQDSLRRAARRGAQVGPAIIASTLNMVCGTRVKLILNPI